MSFPLTGADSAVALDALAVLAKEGGDGQFTVRISARRAGVLVPTLLAAFRDGTLEQIVNGEGWVSKLVGGGEYHLTVSHPSAPAKRYGPVAINIPGAPFQTVNTAAIGLSDWTGPLSCSYPEAAQVTPVALPAPNPYALPGGTPQYTMPRVNVPFTQVAPQMQAQPNMIPAQDGERMLLLQREEARIRAELAAKEAQVNQREMEAKLFREAGERDDKLRREMELKLAQQMAQQKPSTSAMEVIGALTGALAPIMAAFIQSGQQSRDAAAAQQQRQMEMTLAAQERQSNMMQTLLLKMGERPNTSPEMTAMLEMSRFQAEAQGSMMTRIVEAMGVVSKTSVAMIETVAEFSAPPEGSPVLDAVREGTKALMALAKGAESGARGSIAARPAQLPAQVAQQNAQRQAQSNRAAQVEHAARMAAEAEAARIAPATPITVPAVPVATTSAPLSLVPAPTPTPAPNMPAAHEQPHSPVAAPAPIAGFADYAEEPALPNGFAGIVSTVEELEQRIRSHTDAETTAAYFFDSLNSHEMRVALDEVNGEPSALIASQLGAWCLDPENLPYLTALGEAVERIGVERGLMEADEDEDTVDGAALAASNAPAPATQTVNAKP